MKWQPTLATDFVRLRPLKEADFAALYAVASDPLIWEQHPNNDRYEEAVFRVFFQAGIRSGGALALFDRTAEQLIGSSRFQVIPAAPDVVEIGWTFLARSHWGGLYNRAIKNLMINYAFEHVEGVLFYVGDQNFRSQRAVEKLGARLLKGTDYPHIPRKVSSPFLYRLERADWQQGA